MITKRNHCPFRWALIWALSGAAGFAQIVGDPVFGTRVSGPAGDLTISGGRAAGANLFHRFERFGIPADGAATFRQARSIERILAQVTGGESVIEGRLRVEDAGSPVELFLINPRGVVFKDGAQLDVSGAVTLTTADRVRFADGKDFSPETPPNITGLSTTAPRSLEFTATSPGAMEIENLEFEDRPGMAMVGGDVRIEGAGLQGTPAVIVSAGSPGVVEDLGPETGAYRTTSFERMGVVHVSGGQDLSVEGTPLHPGGGRLLIRSGRLLIDGARITHRVRPNHFENPVGIEFDVREELTMTGATVRLRGSGNSRGANLSIRAGSMSMSGESNIEAIPRGIADENFVPGSVALDIRGTLTMTGGSQIRSESTATDPAMAAGAVGISSGALLSLEEGSAVQSTAAGAGPGASIEVAAAHLRIGDRGFLRSIPTGAGPAGDITLVTDSLHIDGGGFLGSDGKPLLTGISTRTGVSSEGVGASIRATVSGSTTIENGGVIDASTRGRSPGGEIQWITGSLTVDGKGFQFPTGMTSFTESQFEPDAGRGGSIEIAVRDGDLRIADGGSIDTSSFGYGSAGDVTIDLGGGDLEIARGSMTNKFTGIGSDASGHWNGDAGKVSVLNGGLVQLREGGLVSTAVFTPPDGDPAPAPRPGDRPPIGGDVTVNAERIEIAGAPLADGPPPEEGASVVNLSAIFAGAEEGSGRTAGGVRIDARRVQVTDGATIGVASPGVGGDPETGAGAVGGGDAGSIQITAEGIRLDSGASISALAGIDGGNIDLAGGVDSYLVANDSTITANAVLGDGGNIRIATDVALANNSPIEASSEKGIDGEVRIDAVADLSGDSGAGEEEFLSAADEIQDQCRVNIPGGRGSFILVGRGGLPVLPGRMTPSLTLMPLP